MTCRCAFGETAVSAESYLDSGSVSLPPPTNSDGLAGCDPRPEVDVQPAGASDFMASATPFFRGREGERGQASQRAQPPPMMRGRSRAQRTPHVQRRVQRTPARQMTLVQHQAI